MIEWDAISEHENAEKNPISPFRGWGDSAVELFFNGFKIPK
jgi:hypothetical protein